MDVDPLALDPAPAPAGLGWDTGWASSFAPLAAAGLVPGRKHGGD